jgi:hypothetical protein
LVKDIAQIGPATRNIFDTLRLGRDWPVKPTIRTGLGLIRDVGVDGRDAGVCFVTHKQINWNLY